MNIFRGAGQTWLGLVVAVMALWLPNLLAEPLPTTHAQWVSRIASSVIGTIGAIAAMMGRPPGAASKEETK